MSTFCSSGFRRRDVFTQRSKDAVGIIVDADDPHTAVETGTAMRVAPLSELRRIARDEIG